ncbi:hypothetical protein DAEQUDRAFT_86836 [Daedalea quercina L-15889]|uniref:Uncharacterized protein n=1 Tax=Daedalea quercina L-15889 TaxID=1314783 RepID=A0A165L028_9APHY|nr:hypothetical protein DAEQUDRAFT_86836 [Daedalea quercina L-15889]
MRHIVHDESGKVVVFKTSPTSPNGKLSMINLTVRRRNVAPLADDNGLNRRGVIGEVKGLVRCGCGGTASRTGALASVPVSASGKSVALFGVTDIAAIWTLENRCDKIAFYYP